MLVVISLVLPVVGALTLLILRAVRSNFSYGWVIAAGSAFLTWLATLLWAVDLPQTLPLANWQPASIFNTSPTFYADTFAWIYAISLTSVALAVILSAALTIEITGMETWGGVLLVTALGLGAALAQNPLTLLMMWAAIDLVELAITVRAVREPSASESAVVSFSARLIGTGLALWASVVAVSDGNILTFENIPANAGLFVLTAAGLRLGVLPLHLPSTTEPLRRGFGTVLRVVSASASLILLARLPIASIPAEWIPALIGLTAFASAYAAWRWMRAPQVLAGRPYWVIALAGFALIAALRGNPAGSVAWGSALILCGAMTFLYIIRARWLTLVLLTALWGISALPFSLAGTGWAGSAEWDWLFLPLLVGAHAMLLFGTARFLLQPGDSLNEQPRWSQVIYPAGLVSMAALTFGLGLWNGAQAAAFGWHSLLSLSALILGLAGIWLMSKIPDLQAGTPHAATNSRVVALVNPLWRAFWALYNTLGRFLNTLSATLEGEGGLLWMLVLLVIFISVLRGG
jgi:hypothetical protein